MGHFNLPEGWTLAHYNDVYISASNGTGGSQNKEGVGIPVSRIETIANENIDYDRIGFLEKYDEAKIQRHKLMKGDILFSHINSPIHLGKTAIYDGKHTLYHGINLLRIIVDKSVILPQVFNWHCKYTRNQGEFSLRAQHAVNQSSLNQKKLGEFEIPIPPLAEQRVIVEKLDTLLAKVETTKARLERIPEILKIFRQSVLAAAVAGKLTEKWRGNAKYIANKVIFGTLILSSSVGLVRSASEQHDDASGRYPYLKMNNIDNFWGHNTDKLKFVDASSEEIRKYSLKKSDWLFNTRNSSELVGKSCVWQGKEGLLYNNNILRVRFKDSVLPEFIEVFVKSPKGQHLLNSIKSGTTNVAAIYQKQLFQLAIDKPSLDEQTEIVRHVKDLFAFAEHIEQKSNLALNRVNSLTQSILAKAFRGDLTADWRAANQELITGQNSAETLLKKIKEARQKLKPTWKARTQK